MDSTSPLTPPPLISRPVAIGFGVSVALHLGFLFFFVLPAAPKVVIEEEPKYDLVDLQNIPKPPPPKPPEPKKPSKPSKGSAPRKIFQVKAGDASIATVKQDKAGAVDGDLAGGTGEGAGNSLGSGSGPVGDPEPAPPPPPPPPPPEPLPLVKAKIASQVAPVYPESARAAGQEGRVIVRAWIDENGNVTRTKVMRSSGFPELDAAAVASVQATRFEPARRGSVAEASKVDVPINFGLS